MVTAATALPAVVTSVLGLEPAEACPACGGDMTGVELRVELAADPEDQDVGVIEVPMRVVRTIAAGVPCGCVIHDRAEPRRHGV